MEANRPTISYVTVDVFTDRAFAGNPLAVVPDAQGLSTADMQAITREFNYSETAFLLPAADPRNEARLRIFNPRREMPFAGHPVIGTAYVLARGQGPAAPGRFTLEVRAGTVAVEIAREGGEPVGAELAAPERFSRQPGPHPRQAASLLGLEASDVRLDVHPPAVASVGMPFLVVELSSRAALASARPVGPAFALLPEGGADAVYAYFADAVGMHARMFTSRLVEDPATGSATAAMAGLRLSASGGDELRFEVMQGEDMGRPSRLCARAAKDGGGIRAFVGGRCVPVMSGSLEPPRLP